MRYKKKGKILALVLSGALLGMQLPGTAMAEEAAGYTGGICEHCPAHTLECGYEEAAEGKGCTFVCGICGASEGDGIESVSLSETETEVLTVRNEKAAGTAEPMPSAEKTESGTEEAEAEEKTDSEIETSAEKAAESGTEETEAEEETDSEIETSAEKAAESGTEETEAEETSLETEASPEKTAAKGKNAAKKTPASDEETETDEAVTGVQAMIDALPSVEEVEQMSPEEQKEVYNDAQEAADAYFDGLSKDQQERVNLTRLMNLMNYFNGQVSTMAYAVVTVKIGNTTKDYPSLEEALNAAKDTTATVTLKQDTTLRGYFEITGNVTFVGEKYKVTGYAGTEIVVCGGLVIESGTFDGVSLSCMDGTITVNGGSVDDLYMFMLFGGSEIIVNGGNIDSLQRLGNGTITINGGTVGKISGSSGNLIYNPPDVTVSIESVTAGSITVTPLENTATFGGAQYSLDGQNWQDSNELKCKANRSYTVYARYSKVPSKSWHTIGTSRPASYTISIPSSMLTAGDDKSIAEISVETTMAFDLGYRGQVQVKVKNDGAVSQDGKLTLRGQNVSGTLTSAMLVNGANVADITMPVATFTMDNYQSAKAVVSFAEPQPTDEQAVTPAGTYSGTVAFEVKYSELEGGTE